MTNWQNISDDELDDIFRDASEKFEVGYEADSWQKMTQKLDTAKPNNSISSVWIRRSLLLLALLFISTVGWIGYEFFKDKKQNLSQNEVKSEGNPNQKNVSTDKVTTDKEQSKGVNKLSNEQPSNNLIKNEVQSTDNLTTDKEQSKGVNKLSNEQPSNNLIKNEVQSTDNLTTDKEQSSNDSKKELNQSKDNLENEISTNKIKTEKQNLSSNTSTDKFQSNSKISLDKTKQAGRSNIQTNKLGEQSNSFDEYKPKQSSHLTNKIETENTNSENIVNERVGEKSTILRNNFGNSTNQTEINTRVLKDKTNENVSKSVDNQVVMNNSGTVSQRIESGVSSKVENSIEPQIIKKLTANLKTFSTHSFNLLYSKSLPNIAYFLPPTEPIQKAQVGDMFKRGLYLRPVFSPDLSTIAGNKIGKIGSNWGILAEYRFGKRLNLQAGVIRSVKLYDAYPDQYTYVWKHVYTPLKEISATCKMLDFPLNIRYDLIAKPNTRLFISTGVTGYSMLNEKYVYDYEDNSHWSIKWKEWEGNTGKYLWSTANISLGFERQIAKKWTIQVEPFVKIPLDSVGFGKVKLLSAGVFVSAKFPLIRKK